MLQYLTNLVYQGGVQSRHYALSVQLFEASAVYYGSYFLAVHGSYQLHTQQRTGAQRYSTAEQALGATLLAVDNALLNYQIKGIPCISPLFCALVEIEMYLLDCRLKNEAFDASTLNQFFGTIENVRNHTTT